MKVALKDCIQLNAFKDAKIVVGGETLTRIVKSISVLEAAGSKEALKRIAHPDELVISGFWGIENDEEAQLNVVKTLAEAGNAGLIILASAKLDELSKEVTDEAQKLALPLLFIAKGSDVTASRIISEVMNKILYGDNFGNKLISNTIFHLLNFEKNSNFQAALHDAAVNNDFQVIIMSEDFNPILSVETRHRANVSDVILEGKSRELGDGVYTMIDVDGILTYWGPLMIAGEKHYMFIVDNNDSYTAGEITKLAEIIELAMGM